MADPDDPATDGGLAQAVNEEVIVSLPAVAAAVAAATTISTGTHSSTASQATIASTLSGSSTMNATPPPGNFKCCSLSFGGFCLIFGCCKC